MTMAARTTRHERGATMVEYALLVSLLVVVSLGVIQSLEDKGESKVASRSDGIGQPTESNELSGPGTTSPTTPPTSTPPPTPLTVHIGTLAGTASQSGNDWSATVTITVLDADGNPAQGVTVTGAWSLPGGGTTCSPTDATGECSITSASFQRKPDAGSVPSVTFTIVALSGANITYDPSADSSAMVTITKP